MPVRGLVSQVLAQVVGGLADLTLAGQEDEDVAADAARPQLIDRIDDGVVEAVLAAFLERPPALLDREQPARDHDDWRGPIFPREVVGEPLRIDGGRGDDDLQVGPAREDLPQVAQQEVDVEAALVRLVDDQRVVGAQQRVGLRFGQQDAVGHQLDAGARLQPVLEAHLVAHHLAQRRLQLLGDALGHAAGRDPTRLGVAHELAAVDAAAAQLQHDLGQLGGLARAGLAADDHHLVLGDQARDFRASCRDRQGFGKFDGQRGGAGGRGGGCTHGARIMTRCPAAQCPAPKAVRR